MPSNIQKSVDNAQLCWTLSIDTHYVSEIGSISILRGKWGMDSNLLGPLERASLDHWISIKG
jgi:hypothetical protein